MNDKTPNRIQRNDDFSPISLRQSPAASASSQRSLSGIQKLAHDLSVECYNNVQEWNEIHIKGSHVVKEIAILKAENPKHFEEALENLMDDLCSIINKLEKVKNQFNSTLTRANAMSIMQKPKEPLFISLNANQFANLIANLAEAYESAFQDKKLVRENIAHSKSKEEAMFYAAMWTYQCKISDDIDLKLETLLIESGLRKISY